MKIKTHMLIARKLHRYMDENYSEHISRKLFIFGNIKPDFVRKFKTLKHSIHDSLDYVLEEVARFEHEKHSEKNPSVHLGVINHYLSDFFCSKHYFKNDDEGLIKHIKYESRLHKTIKAMDAGGALELEFFNVAENIHGSFLEILRELEYEYIKRPPSIENDIIFALCVPLMALKFLFRGQEAAGPEALKQVA